MPTENIRLIKLGQLIKRMEIGDINNPENKNYKIVNENQRVIVIQNAGDGFVTIGNGHAIQSDEDASKYGFDVIRSNPDFANFSFSDINTSKKIDEVIEAQQNYYKSIGQRNPAELSLEAAEILMLEDLSVKRDIAVRELSSNSFLYSQNMIDGLTSVLYNGNKLGNENSLSYNMVHGSKEDSLNILHKAIDEGWYGEYPEGTLRRRLMEFNIFYNNDYTFYDSNDFEKLKQDTGYSS